jgi:hypothetical protein
MQITCSASIFKYAESLVCPLKYLGNECVVWSPEKRAIFDMVEELRPNILVVAPNESSEILKEAQHLYNFQLIYFGFGESNVQPDVWCVPQNTPENIKTNIVNSHELKKCANLSKLGKPYYDDELNYDLIYFSEEDFSKTPEVTETLIMLSTLDISFVIVGPIRVPLPQYLGTVTLQDKVKLMCSCKIGLDFNLINAFNFALYKKPCIYECGMKMIPKIQYYLKNEEGRHYDGNEAHNYIKNNNLVDFSEAAKILQLLGYSELSNQCIETQQKLLASW